VAYKAAPTEATILIRGESGTGKGVLARAIHARGSRAAAPFVTINCPSLSAELLESEMFGHVKGAFTGAVRDTLGKVAAAEGGTLFLDEVGDLPLGLQPKLLRLLQEKRYERVGETRSSPGRPASASRPSPRRRARPWLATPGRVMCANCATPSSAASSWLRGQRWGWQTSPPRSAPRRAPGPCRWAALLGIDPSTLYRKRKRYGI
jgi:DNA-binding NtrC family response regulator